MFLILGLFHAGSARGEDARFGDTTWVAPNAGAFDGVPASAGPRVAEPDVERGWEKALRAPFRLVFYPVRLAARGSQAAITFGSQFINYEPRLIPWLGVKAAPVFGISGTAGPSAGVAIQGRSGIGARATLVGTWSVKDTRRLRLRASITEPQARAVVELYAAYDYRPNRRFYGIGNETVEDGKSIYLRRENVAEAALVLGKNPHRRIRGIVSFSDIDVGAGYRDEQRAQDVYDPEDVPFLTEESTVASVGAGADFALLDNVDEPSLGIHVRGEARRFGSVDESNVHYVSWYGEGRAYLPVLASRRVIAVRYVYEGVDPRSGSDPVPFYRLPTTSNEVRFAAFRSNRFMDQHLMLGHAEYRWIVLPQYDIWATVFGQLGAVAPSRGAFQADEAHRSIGGGLRAKLSPTTTARLEIAGGDEGTRIYLDLRGDF
ncbi:MAG TPA: hypothetical protein VFP58_09140 [Candidatus Eisenbacteria bacterium]|nr:hypothetical protein [Candidatus Eisenbacteria bacterium]